ncbi:hypothetical protein BLNAU_6303 [Blattamonas nauphoetae]|uniref:TmcB/TmcC TPR repeats domain-containing protein n=1 Tax=Blattamonas nauphoetae TaxID=2049346 RepID=A0ABQ9Y4X7_9EUKA|nr:hypothetical protein BLNAU_6303 [Blattamonas nauphoetae]
MASQGDADPPGGDHGPKGGSAQDKKGTPTFDFVLWLIHFIEYQAVGLFRNYLPFPEQFYKVVTFLNLSGLSYLSNGAFWACVGVAIFLIFLQKSLKWFITYFRYFAKIYFNILVVPSYCWLMNFFLWSYYKEEDPIDYLYPNPSIKEFSVTHIVGLVVGCVFTLLIAGAHIVYNYFCVETNPKGRGLFGRDLGFWGMMLAVDDLAQVVTSYTVSPFWIWRATGLSLWKAFFTYLFWSGKHHYRMEGDMLVCINLLVGMVIDLASLISMTLNDAVSSKVIIFVLTAVFVIACFPFVILIFPRRFRSLWWLHLPGGEMYIDPFNPEHCKPLKNKDPAVYTKPPKRPKRNWIVEVQEDKRVLEIEKGEWEIEEERMLREMEQKKQMREDAEKNAGPSMVEATGNNMTDIDVIAPPHNVHKHPHIPKIYKEESVEPSIRFIYVPKWRNQRRLAYVDQIYKQATDKFTESPTLALTYATYLHWFMKDNKKALTYVQQARQHHPQFLNMFTIFIATRDWQTDAKSGDLYLSAISMQQLNENLPVAESYHKEARQALREFWENLQRPQPDYSRVNPLLEKIDKNQKLAKKKYERLLVEYPNTPSVLRGYGNLLYEVFHDDETAEHFIMRAEEVEEEEMDRRVPGQTIESMTDVDEADDMEDRAKELEREKQRRRMTQIRQHKKRKKQNQAAQLVGLELSGKSKKANTNLYILVMLFLFLLLISGVLAAFFVTNSYCSTVNTHIVSFHQTGSILTLTARLVSLSKMALSIHRGDTASLAADVRTKYFDDLPTIFLHIKDNSDQLYLVQHESILNTLLSSYWEETANYVHCLIMSDQISQLQIRSESIGNVIRSHTQNLNNAAQSDSTTPLSDLTLTALYAIMMNGPCIISERMKKILVSESEMLGKSISVSAVVIMVVMIVVILVVIAILLIYVWRTIKNATINIKSSLMVLSMVPKSTISATLARLQDQADMANVQFDMAPSTTPSPLEKDKAGNTAKANIANVFTTVLQQVRTKNLNETEMEEMESDIPAPSNSLFSGNDPDSVTLQPPPPQSTPKDPSPPEQAAKDASAQPQPSKKNPAKPPKAASPKTAESPKDATPTPQPKKSSGPSLLKPSPGASPATTPSNKSPAPTRPPSTVFSNQPPVVPNQAAQAQMMMGYNPMMMQQNMYGGQMGMMGQEQMGGMPQMGMAGGMMPMSGAGSPPQGSGGTPHHGLTLDINAVSDPQPKKQKGDGKEEDDGDSGDDNDQQQTARTFASLDGGIAARGYDLDVPPTPPSPSAAGAVHFDLSDLNTKVRTEREFKEWTRNVKQAVNEVQSKSLKFPSVIRVSVVIRVILAVAIIVGLGIATILISITSLQKTNVYGNQIVLSQHRTMQLIHMQFLILQLVFNNTHSGITNIAQNETTSPVFVDLAHVMNDQSLIQERLRLAIVYFQRTDSHLRYGSSTYSQTTDKLINSLKTTELEGTISSLDDIMFGESDCRMNTTTYCTEHPDRNYLVTESFTGLDALYQIFISDALHMGNYPPATNLMTKDHFLRLFTLANNDLYYGSLTYSSKLRLEAESFVTLAKRNMSIITIVDCVVYFLAFLIFLLPLRSFFSEIANQSTLLQSLIPEIQHEDLQWKPEYQSTYAPLNANNRRILNLLGSAVELSEENKDDSAAVALKTVAENVMASLKVQFERESQWMKQSQYAEDSDHKKEHKYLLKEAAYLLRFLLHEPDSAVIISNAVQMFFVSHIKRMDVPLGNWLSNTLDTMQDNVEEIGEDEEMMNDEQLQLSDEDMMLLQMIQQNYGIDPQIVLAAAEMGIDPQSLVTLAHTNPEYLQQIGLPIGLGEMEEIGEMDEEMMMQMFQQGYDPAQMMAMQESGQMGMYGMDPNALAMMQQQGQLVQMEDGSVWQVMPDGQMYPVNPQSLGMY